jgi:hypothetical protein
VSATEIRCQPFSTPKPSLFIHPRSRHYGTDVHAEEARSCDGQHELFDTKRSDHSQAYSFEGACSNQAEGYSAACAMRRSRFTSWLEDNRCSSNGKQANRAFAQAMKRGKSADFSRYWQRHLAIQRGVSIDTGASPTSDHCA